MCSFGFLTFAIFLLHIGTHNTVAIECYVCNVMGCNDPFEAGSVAVQTKNFTENWCWKAKGEIEGDKGVIRGGGKYNDWTTQLSCSENKCRDETIGAAKGVVKQYEEAHRLLSTALSDLKDEEPFNYTGYATSLDLMGILKLHSNHPELILSLDIVEKLSQINSPVTVVH
ncbi:unnamed protein product [Rotaria magnacalcarata]|uniref:Uncharacterized protein n=1 Tax=Rotaria magnacalcarata TaxID=392030 RepID=A0A816HF62_9BILA|nr:unnamed protein product [Rotaria magnacalcarata]